MTHLDDGTLQAFLDDELTGGRRAEVADHLLACPACHGRQEELARANALFTRSISLLDVEPPASRPAGGTLRRRARRGTSSFVKAAGLVLALAAAASAAVPGSPVRVWVESVIEPAEPIAEAPAPSVAAPEPPAPSALPAPAGVSITSTSGPLLVALSGLEGAMVRLEGVAGDRATISVLGAERDPTFRTGADRVEVRDGVGGEVRVRLPLGTEGTRLEVDGELYAVTREGALRLHVTADTLGGAIVWQ